MLDIRIKYEDQPIQPLQQYKNIQNQNLWKRSRFGFNLYYEYCSLMAIVPLIPVFIKRGASINCNLLENYVTKKEINSFICTNLDMGIIYILQILYKYKKTLIQVSFISIEN